MRNTTILWLLIVMASFPAPPIAVANDEFQAGSAVVDITPTELPVLINGGFLSSSSDQIKTRIHARAIVLRSGDEQIGLVVVDSCMVPREIINDVKQRVAKRTRLRPDRIMISATHTHSAPSSFAALGTDADLTYIPLLREKLVEALVAAEANLRPAKYGWGDADASELTAVRRWILRPDRIGIDPFGNSTVRANMHAGSNLDDVTGPSGPEDPMLSMIAFQTLDNDPIAVLANFSMHYYSDQPISADYFGLFCSGLEKHLNANAVGTDSSEMKGVGILSHGCSGDIWRRDYFNWNGTDESTIETYTKELLNIATAVYDAIEYSSDGSLAMTQQSLPMKYRVPDQQRLEWAKRIVEPLEGRLPSDRTEVYAREQILLDQMQTTDVLVQAIRIGDIAIATTPNETYALTGLKIKSRSPAAHTMVIELANGADGYIPPAEQHLLGGYNTWPARSAGLEVQAEPRIAATAVSLIENVFDKPQRQDGQSIGRTTQTMLDLQPLAYWRMDEMEGSNAEDCSGHHHDGVYEPGVVFFLEGPSSDRFTDELEVNRCVHFAGGRLQTRLESLGDTFTLVMSFWNGMPSDARETTGWLWSRDHPHAITASGQHLGIGGTATQPGRIIFQDGTAKPIVGNTMLERWTWNRLILIREGKRIRVYVNDSVKPEIETEIEPSEQTTNNSIATWFIGGRCDNDSNFEGRIDEVAVFDRVIEEFVGHPFAVANDSRSN